MRKNEVPISGRNQMNFKPLLLCLVFGILIILVDFNDNSPLLTWVGNLDHIFGPSDAGWYATEVAYPLISLVIFLIFGKVSLELGKKEERTGATANSSKFAALVPLLVFVILLTLIDIDDVLNVLKVRVAFGTNYWLIMEAIYPIGAIGAFLAFGKTCFDFGPTPKSL